MQVTEKTPSDAHGETASLFQLWCGFRQCVRNAEAAGESNHAGRTARGRREISSEPPSAQENPLPRPAGTVQGSPVFISFWTIASSTMATPSETSDSRSTTLSNRLPCQYIPRLKALRISPPSFVGGVGWTSSSRCPDREAGACRPAKDPARTGEGVSPYMLKAIINGRGDEALELARTNLRR